LLAFEQELISCSFAGSPVQLSSVPVLQKERLHDSKFTNAYFFALSSKLPAQPTKNVLQVVFLGLTFPPLLALLNSLTFLIFFIQLAH
jgi:hypothetical protein